LERGEGNKIAERAFSLLGGRTPLRSRISKQLTTAKLRGVAAKYRNEEPGKDGM